MNVPAPITEKEADMIGLSSMQATYAALEAICGDHFHDSYEKARIVFNKDGRFTTVMRDGQCVAHMAGRFSKQELRDALKGNIKDHGRYVAGKIKSILEQKLVLPDTYLFRMDIEDDLRWVDSIRSRQFSAWVVPKVPDNDDPKQVRAEFRFWIAEARAIIFADKGKAWAWQHKAIVTDGLQHPKADTHEELAHLVADTFNKAVEHAGWD
ncbi:MULTISPECIES: hypothetical protein [Pseudomonas]|jgi:hypothetical protein|nr:MULTISPECIES: hypothetical protein [Pseudomonas]WQN30215.1 hypothetical protein ULE26_21855 [Stutzerimonas stutzeri]AGL46211.1 hypothetical protein pOZ176_247 [Pseudomonas aeruginosa PA96]ASU52525.1 Hypothetical protein [Pseudomonas putida]AVE20709.1 Hypothetical protein [Pseudomonas aeruginosa]EIU1446819.1 hypothetical protein [Pseudomonas aeruginosa]